MLLLTWNRLATTVISKMYWIENGMYTVSGTLMVRNRPKVMKTRSEFMGKSVDKVRVVNVACMLVHMVMKKGRKKMPCRRLASLMGSISLLKIQSEHSCLSGYYVKFS